MRNSELDSLVGQQNRLRSAINWSHRLEWLHVQHLLVGSPCLYPRLPLIPALNSAFDLGRTHNVNFHPSLGVPVGAAVGLSEVESFDAVAVLIPAHHSLAESVQLSLQLAVVKPDLGTVMGTGLSLALQMT